MVKNLTPASLIQVTQPSKLFRHSAWVASANGAFESRGPTRQDALCSLSEALTQHALHHDVRIYRFAGETVFVLYYAQGWQYDIVSPAHPTPSTCLLGAAATKQAALEMMEQHWRQHCELVSSPSSDLDEGQQKGSK